MNRILATSFLIILLNIWASAQSTGDVFHQEVTWLPDGKSLSYTTYRKLDPNDKQVKSEIYLMQADGTGVKRIADDARWSSWSRDGKWFVFSKASADNKSSDIFKGRRDGTNVVQLTKETKRNSTPAISPDGKRIVFISTRENEKYQLYIMNSDGSNVTRMASDPSVAYYNPMWSPDSKKIVYYAEKGDQKDQIWTINADGSKNALRTGNIGHNIYPTWSPDGKHIIFSSTRDGEDRLILIMNADGSDLHRLAGVKANIARYSPNGKRLALIVGAFPATSIFIAEADGTKPVKITP